MLFFLRLHILKLCKHLFVCVWWTGEQSERLQSFMSLLSEKQAVSNTKSLQTSVKGFCLDQGRLI